MTSIELEKSRLRKVFKDQRNLLTREEVRDQSAKICENFISNLLPKIYQKNSKKTFSLYFPSGNEASPNLISQHFQENKIPYSYPKIIAKNQPLEFILCDDENASKIAPSSLYPKIFELSLGKQIFPDFIILPLVAFDSELSRLGMGGGFFDRTISFLKTQKTEIVTIGLAYDFQRVRGVLPTEKNDQRLDFTVTEKNIFFSQ